MTVRIDDPELEVEVQRLAEAWGKPVDEVVRESLKVAVAQHRVTTPRKTDLAAVRRIQEEVARLPRLDRKPTLNAGGRGHEESALGGVIDRPTVADVLGLIASFPVGPISYERSDDEILGYGPNGYCE